MFSVQQKRDISTAVQKILRDTAHPELPPPEREITFNLKVIGEEAWSWAEIKNNAAVTDPDMNPHNEIMAAMPEEEARELIKDVKNLTGDAPPRHLVEDYIPEDER